MERKDSKIDEAEFDVIDEVYFVTPYEEALRNSGLLSDIFDAALRQLLRKKYIWQMKYSDRINDFIKLDEPDLEHLNRYNYLASKEGLLAHNI